MFIRESSNHSKNICPLLKKLKTATGEVVTGRKLRMNKNKIKEQELLDGYYVIVTNNLELNPMQIRHVYRKIKITEEDFKILKSYLKIRPIYLRTPKTFLHISRF